MLWKLRGRRPAWISSALELAGRAGEILRRLAGDELKTLRAGEVLTGRGDTASGAWIIERGEIEIGSPRLALRRAGDLVGEAGVLRPGTRRSSDLIAFARAQLWCISREAIDALPDDERAEVYLAIAACLHDKLYETVDQRTDQLHDIDARETLLKAFVPESGLKLIRARLFKDANAPEIYRAVRGVIFFSDIAGFSALVKTMEPREAGKAAIELQTPIVEAITAHGGELDKLMGDGAMGFWLANGETIAPQIAHAVIDAAMKTAADVRSIAKSRGWSDVDVRVGLHCGEFLVGDFGAAGRRSYTAIGPVVNAAARYEQARETHTGKPLGPVRVSPALFELLPEQQRLLFEAKPRRFKEKFPPMLEVHRLRRTSIGEDE